MAKIRHEIALYFLLQHIHDTLAAFFIIYESDD